MASSLDLQEQEQLDALKAAWEKYGNLITWVLVIVMLVVAGWYGWQWYQRNQASSAGPMYDELERAVQAGDADRIARAFGDLKARYPRTAIAQQGALLAAKGLYEKQKVDDAQAALAWVVESGSEEEYQALARLRLAGIQLEKKQYDEALKTLDAVKEDAFKALVADRRGDVQLAQGKAEEAKASYKAAWDALPETAGYRDLVESKLSALGAAPGAKPADAAASAASAVPAAASGASR